MPTLRLTYFDFPFWRAETSRLALHIGGIPFDDHRISGDVFRAIKERGELPYGQLPVLDVDGERIAQATAIARYCGKLAGLYPQGDDLAAAKVDELLDVATDISWRVRPSIREKDAARKAEMRKELAESTLPTWLAFVEKRAAATDGPYLIGNTLTVADLAIWRLFGWLSGGVLDGIPTDLLEAHPNVREHFEHIGSLPKVVEWMKRYE